MAITTVASLNNLFNDIYEDALFVARETTVMANLVTNYSARGWMARKITQRPALSAEDLTDGVDITTPQTFGKTLRTELVPTEKGLQVVLTDADIETDPDDARADAAYELGAAIAEKIDTDLVGLFTSLTKDKGPGVDQPASIAAAAAAVSVLRANKAPNPIYAVVHPYHWHAIWTELGKPAANYAFLGEVANQALRDFFVGQWLNVLWFTSANIPVEQYGGTGDNAVSGFFNTRALALDTRRKPRLEVQRDASLRGWELNMTVVYAIGVRRDEFGVKFTASAEEPTA